MVDNCLQLFQLLSFFVVETLQSLYAATQIDEPIRDVLFSQRVTLAEFTVPLNCHRHMVIRFAECGMSCSRCSHYRFENVWRLGCRITEETSSYTFHCVIHTTHGPFMGSKSTCVASAWITWPRRPCCCRFDWLELAHTAHNRNYYAIIFVIINIILYFSYETIMNECRYYKHSSSTLTY